MALLSARSVVNLESTALLVQQSRYQSRLSEGPSLVQELLELCEQQMEIESKKEADPRMSRARRQVFLSRRNELVGRFRNYSEMLRMSREEYNSRVYLHYKNRQWNLSRASYFIQPLEACLSTLTEKLRRRMEGYTQQIVDSLHAENAVTQSLYARIMSERIWRVHRMICEYVDSGTAPSIPELLEFLPLQEDVDTPIVLHEIMYMVHCLQLAEVLCTRSSDGEDGMSLIDSIRIGNRARMMKSKSISRSQTPATTHRGPGVGPSSSSSSSDDNILSRVTIPALAAQLIVAAFRMLKSIKRAGRQSYTHEKQSRMPRMTMTIGGVEGELSFRELTHGVIKKKSIVVSVLLSQTFRTLKAVLQTKEAAERFVERSSFLIKTPPALGPTGTNTASSSIHNSQTQRRTSNTIKPNISGSRVGTSTTIAASKGRGRGYGSTADDDDNDDLHIQPPVSSAAAAVAGPRAAQKSGGKPPLFDPSILPSSLSQNNKQQQQQQHQPPHQHQKQQKQQLPNAEDAAVAAASALGFTTGTAGGRPGVSSSTAHPTSSGGARNTRGTTSITTGGGVGGSGSSLKPPPASGTRGTAPFDTDSDEDDNDHHSRSSKGAYKSQGKQQQPVETIVSDKFWGSKDSYDIMSLVADVVTWMQVVVAARAGGRDLAVLIEPSEDESDGVLKRKQPKKESKGAADDPLPKGGGGVCEDYGEFKSVLLDLDVELLSPGSQLITNIQYCANRIIRAMVDPHASLTGEHTQDYLNDSSDAAIAASVSLPWRARQSAVIRRSLNSGINKPHFSVLPKLYAYPIVRDLISVSSELAYTVTNRFMRFLAPPPNGKTSYPFIGDTLVLREIEKEATEALKLISAISSSGYITRCSAATILESGKLTQHRTMSYFMIHAWLQNLHAAVANVLFSGDGTTEDTYDKKTGLLDVSGRDISVYVDGECRHVDRCQSYDAMSKFIATQADSTITSTSTTTATATAAGSKSSSLLKESLRSYLGGSIANLFLVMSNHRSSVSILHSSLLMMRLLFRDVFVKKAVLDDFMGVESASDYVQTTENVGADNMGKVRRKRGDGGGEEAATPTGTGTGTAATTTSGAAAAVGGGTSASTGTARRRAGALKENFKLAPDDSTVSITTAGDTHEIADPWSISQTNISLSSGNIGGESEPGQETKEYFEKWRQNALQHVLSDFQDSGLRELSFPDLMAYIGETHILCDELMEQYLLFIQHLAGISGVCKLALVEAGVTPILERILEAKRETKNLLLISLCEICIEDLNVDVLNIIY